MGKVETMMNLTESSQQVEQVLYRYEMEKLLAKMAAMEKEDPYQ